MALLTQFFVAVISLAALALSQNFNNPVLWEDLADNEVIRVDNAYYYTASTMHYSPGAPILRSYDLVNWEYLSHAVPTLAWGSKYDLAAGQQAYVKGIYASTLRFRKSNGLWYWMGCIEYTGTYVFTAPSPTGPWSQKARIATCYYDAGLLVDDDDTMYVAYGNTELNVAQLSADGLSEVRKQAVYSTPSNIGALEGSRMYKRNGKYYIFVTKPATSQYVLQASSPWGPYTIKALVESVAAPVSGAGNPHQGSLVDTPDGRWYYMAFIDNYPGGRVPVLAPVTWGSDGFPTVTLSNGAWGKSYPYPVTQKAVQSTLGTDAFAGSSLGPAWEWNHNPDTTKFKVNNGLTLSTATVTNDLYAARNTLTKRIHGPVGVGTVIIDFTSMADGDRAGLSLLRQDSAYIAVERSGSAYSIVMYNGLKMVSSTWATASTGSQAASTPISQRRVWLRATADINPGAGKKGSFSYSLDGSTFVKFGSELTLNNEWPFFMGYRYGIFNFATKALGGSVKVESFTVA
ncbi:putative glycosyl hydrolase family 43 [Colletotrichum karsti]|uniref:Glycosyl hydrolase family 43 n=1 Tax=Colletotrichum karsti TaxID=1095194 RepID=A0A9P6I6E6_9PEZI|nr:putative glycosyl hydrolase family 43 [Colletotrichum karsti]KAF9872845.1 putative glycosyl hydrolase family 43 [Colletotrichum karsti]